jgi:protein phosphatase
MTTIAYHLDRGPRERLEDSAKAFQLKVPGRDEAEISAMILCDGVGGSNGGDVASDSAVELIAMQLASALLGESAASLHSEAVGRLLEGVLSRTNGAIVDIASRDPNLGGMAATVVCALVIGRELHVAWAGDSRCYVVGQSRIQQITRDHSEVQDLIDQGFIQARDAKGHLLSHVITNSLGRKDGFHAETTTHRLRPGDVILQCTDGLTDVVSDERILEHVQRCLESQTAFQDLPRALVQEALRAGTQDNCSVLCCDPATDYFDRGANCTKTLTNAYSLASAGGFHLLKETDDV